MIGLGAYVASPPQADFLRGHQRSQSCEALKPS
jgi:hypothetical protein